MIFFKLMLVCLAFGGFLRSENSTFAKSPLGLLVYGPRRVEAIVHKELEELQISRAIAGGNQLIARPSSAEKDVTVHGGLLGNNIIMGASALLMLSGVATTPQMALAYNGVGVIWLYNKYFSGSDGSPSKKRIHRTMPVPELNFADKDIFIFIEGFEFPSGNEANKTKEIEQVLSKSYPEINLADKNSFIFVDGFEFPSTEKDDDNEKDTEDVNADHCQYLSSEIRLYVLLLAGGIALSYMLFKIGKSKFSQVRHVFQVAQCCSTERNNEMQRDTSHKVAEELCFGEDNTVLQIMTDLKDFDGTGINEYNRRLHNDPNGGDERKRPNCGPNTGQNGRLINNRQSKSGENNRHGEDGEIPRRNSNCGPNTEGQNGRLIYNRQSKSGENNRHGEDGEIPRRNSLHKMRMETTHTKPSPRMVSSGNPGRKKFRKRSRLT